MTESRIAEIRRHVADTYAGDETAALLILECVGSVELMAEVAATLCRRYQVQPAELEGVIGYARRAVGRRRGDQ